MASNNRDFERKAADIIGLYLDRRSMRRSSAWMKSRPFRPWSGWTRRCRCRPAGWSGRDSSTIATAPCGCTLPWTWREVAVEPGVGESARSGARITQRKDGRTHLAYKAEHAVDLDTVVALTVQPADRGDTESLKAALGQASRVGMARQAADLLTALCLCFLHLTHAANRGPLVWLLDPAGQRPGGLIRRVAVIDRCPVTVRLYPRAASGASGGDSALPTGSLMREPLLGADVASVCHGEKTVWNVMD
jgi:hypothetical protein